MKYCSIPSRIIKVIGYSLTVLVFMILLQRVVKVMNLGIFNAIFRFVSVNIHQNLVLYYLNSSMFCYFL